MNYIILDLEATCWSKKGSFTNEIIEIGAVCINQRQALIGEYNSFVKPKLYPELSDFCKELTTIKQEEVDAAETFPVVLDDFLEWIESFGGEYWLCSWGFYDRSQFKKDCELHGLDTTWLRQHISLKHQYADIYNLSRPLGMKGALNREQIQMEGTHHRGIDDAKNIAKIFLNNFDYWTLA
ncbi:3'-5' exonuclease [Aureispira anguillae]|uniref:Exonuclease domain-containing protein n=1 Tax=Aureispira anguillae TaxID=2864201 RepID=A0A915YFS0_9BACT|nr:3'-5' exonuclease [Aureispira anguillae]BDS12210.1 exonuclease domain-containing protein [Aureispira anguillae]